MGMEQNKWTVRPFEPDDYMNLLQTSVKKADLGEIDVRKLETGNASFTVRCNGVPVLCGGIRRVIGPVGEAWVLLNNYASRQQKCRALLMGNELLDKGVFRGQFEKVFCRHRPGVGSVRYLKRLRFQFVKVLPTDLSLAGDEHSHLYVRS